ncbi:MAG: ABC transporter ATP-binding protein [Pseudomonadota bacterium]
MFRYFENLIDPYPPEEPVQPPKGLVAFCWHYAKPMRKYFLWMMAFTAAISITEVIMFGWLGQLVDWLAESDPQTFFSEQSTILIVMSLVVLVLYPVLILIGNLLIHQTLIGNFPMTVRWLGHRYLLGQSLAYFQDEFAGRVSTKLMQSSLAVREVVMKVCDVLLYVAVYFGGMLVLVATADWRLVAPLLVWLVAYVAMLKHFVPKLSAVSKVQADARSVMTGRIVDSYTNIETVKLFAHARRELDYAKEGMDTFMVTVHDQMRLVTKLYTVLFAANSLLLFSVGALSIMFWQSGAVSLGAVAIAIGLVLRLNGMSQWIMWEVTALFENIGTVEDGIEMLARDREVQDKPGAPNLAVNKGEIAFDQVSFHYGKTTGVIDDLSLIVKPGEKLGLVGRSGAGKSTLVNLLLRYYDLEGGVIRIDGENIAEVRQESLRSQIGMVTQDTSLLHRSVMENIRYGQPDATLDDVIAAAKKAEAHDFILDLEDVEGRRGYHAHVGERGVKLSGGQRQRIAISRVLLKDAPILLLDEATSALDSEVEAVIQESLYRLMEGKTVIAIAHRLSTIAAMDRLIVMDHGKVIEEGSHADLVAKGGVYADLWDRQSGGFINVEMEAAE